MLCKVTALHVYSHEDASSAEIENCLQCDLAIENQVSEFSATSNFSFVSSPEVVFDFRKVFYHNNNTALLSPLRFKQFGRPPPVAV